MEQEIKIGQIWHYNSAWVKGAWKEYEIIEINKVAKTQEQQAQVAKKYSNQKP